MYSVEEPEELKQRVSGGKKRVNERERKREREKEANQRADPDININNITEQKEGAKEGAATIAPSSLVLSVHRRAITNNTNNVFYHFSYLLLFLWGNYPP